MADVDVFDELLTKILEESTASTATFAPAREAPSRTGESPLKRAAGLRDVKSIEAYDATERYHDAIVEDLDQRAMVKARKGLPAILDELADRGFSWRDVARLAGVSVPAVRKWRAGGTHAAERRLDLARVVGLCELLDECHVVDPAGWLEMPVVKSVPVTWLDLYLAGREELVVGAASNRQQDVHRVLDQFDRSWRERNRSDFEVFQDVDGKPSIRAKRR
jgi:hypothetical protein